MKSMRLFIFLSGNSGEKKKRNRITLKFTIHPVSNWKKIETKKFERSRKKEKNGVTFSGKLSEVFPGEEGRRKTTYDII